MRIDSLIKKDLASVCVAEEMRFVKQYLKRLGHLLVLSETMSTLGIVTMNDVNAHPHTKLKDLDFYKLSVTAEISIKQAYEVMLISGDELLLVYDRRCLIGIITLKDIKNALVYKIIPAYPVTKYMGW